MHAIVIHVLNLVHKYHHDGREMTFYITHHTQFQAQTRPGSWWGKSPSLYCMNITSMLALDMRLIMLLNAELLSAKVHSERRGISAQFKQYIYALYVTLTAFYVDKIG